MIFKQRDEARIFLWENAKLESLLYWSRMDIWRYSQYILHRFVLGGIFVLSSKLVGTVSSRSRALASPSARSERAKARKWFPSISQDQGKSICFPSPSDFLEKLKKSQERKLERNERKLINKQLQNRKRHLITENDLLVF